MGDIILRIVPTSFGLCRLGVGNSIPHHHFPTLLEVLASARERRDGHRGCGYVWRKERGRGSWNVGPAKRGPTLQLPLCSLLFGTEATWPELVPVPRAPVSGRAKWLRAAPSLRTGREKELEQVPGSCNGALLRRGRSGA